MTVRARDLRSAFVAAYLASLVAGCGSNIATPSPTSPSSSIATPGESATAAPPTAPPPTPVGSTADAPPCVPPDVAVAVTGQGAGGSILLTIQAMNRGTAPCAVNGPPSSLGLRSGGGSLPLTYQPHPDPFPGDTPNVVARPVILAPGDVATAKAIWSNWCLGPADVSTIWVGLGTEAVDTYPNPAITPARCDNKNAESSIAGFPFEAGTGG